MTITVYEFMNSDEYCGGMNGKKLKALVPGGSSVPILPANLMLKTAAGEDRLMTTNLFLMAVLLQDLC
jgi:NADH-quinone oxidoreductase subunit F